MRAGDVLLAFGGSALRGYDFDGQLQFELGRDIAAGHSPTITLSPYAHLFDEAASAERISAEDEIRRARQLVRGERRTRFVPDQPMALTLWEDESRANPGEPTPGLEPGTPSLRVKCSTS
jgi:hypothetical protein